MPVAAEAARGTTATPDARWRAPQEFRAVRRDDRRRRILDAGCARRVARPRRRRRRAIAAAVLGDAVRSRRSRRRSVSALQTGEVDVLSRITTITFQRDVQLGIEFPAINWYDGTTFIVRKSSKVKSVDDLSGATICLQPGTTNEVDVADYFQAQAHVHAGRDRAARRGHQRVLRGRCDAFSQDQATLAALRARAPNPADHVVLPELISRGPCGPASCRTILRWIEIVRWSVYAMVNAERLGLTSTTIDRALESDDPDVRRFVGSERRLRSDARPRRGMGLPDRQAGRQLRRERRTQHHATGDRARRQPTVEGRRRDVRAATALISTQTTPSVSIRSGLPESLRGREQRP